MAHHELHQTEAAAALAAKIARMEQLREENAADRFPSFVRILAESGWRPAEPEREVA